MKTVEKTKKKTGNSAARRSYLPKTARGKRLWALRQKCVAEAGKLLDWAGLEREVRFRKGQSESR